jgi:hypothetical protein
MNEAVERVMHLYQTYDLVEADTPYRSVDDSIISLTLGCCNVAADKSGFDLINEEYFEFANEQAFDEFNELAKNNFRKYKIKQLLK